LGQNVGQNDDWAEEAKDIVGDVNKTVVLMFALQKDCLTMQKMKLNR